jgi:ketosteroid isomerase-like protein
MPPGSPSIKGRRAIEAFFTAKFEKNCVLELVSANSHATGSQAFDTGTITVTMPGADSSPAQVVTGKYLAVFRRVADAWKMTHHMQTVDPAGTVAPLTAPGR